MNACLNYSSSEIDVNSIQMKIYNEWIYVFKINDLKTNGEIINRPPGFERLIFRLLIPTEGGTNLKTQCIYYMVPYKKILGYFKIVEQRNDSACPDISNSNSWLEFKEISDLQVKLENFKLFLDFKHGGQKVNWSFPLPNIVDGVIHERYQAVKFKKLLPNLMLLRINEESFDNNSSRYFGRMSDRLSRGSAIRCHQIDKNCQTINENRCAECAYGWYSVVDYNCPQGGSKFCGQNHCGEKNEPACLRGARIVEQEDAGICQSDLRPVFNADHILICQ